jgi:hypothetical protein
MSRLRPTWLRHRRPESHHAAGALCLAWAGSAAAESCPLESLFEVPQQIVIGGSATSGDLGDFNNDGILDIVTLSEGVVKIARGHRDGTFMPPLGFPAGFVVQSLTTADLNNDGNLDVAVSYLHGVSVLLGNGEGDLGPPIMVPTGLFPSWIVACDVDVDGDLDLVVSTSGGVGILLGDGSGSFIPRTPLTAGPGPIVASDLNEDGQPDLAVREFDNVSILIGDGRGGFAAFKSIPADGSGGISAVDFNGDHQLDLVVGGNDERKFSTDSISILIGDGTGSFAAPTSFEVGDSPGSIVVDDLDGDGDLDVAVANFASQYISLLLGDGAGAFAAQVRLATGGSSGGGPSSITAGDIDGDADLDLAVELYIGEVLILPGDGAGGFAAPLTFPTGDNPESVTTGDFNGDGDLDLIAANSLGNTVSVLLGDGTGAFASAGDFAAGNNPRSITAGDFDRDGDLDLAVAKGSAGVSVLLGSGAGGFSAPVAFAAGSGSVSVAAGDFNGDADLDLVVANWFSHNVSILRGHGSGAFDPPANFAVGPNPRFVSAGDFDDDGDLDLAVACESSDDVWIMIGDGKGGFVSSVPLVVGDRPWSVAPCDLDHDGALDLSVVNLGSHTVSILLGHDDGTFDEAMHFAAGSWPTSVMAADLDYDANLDLAVAQAFRDDVLIMLGDGTGALAAPRAFLAGYGQSAVTAADFDGDDAIDIAVAHWSLLVGSGVTVLLNQCLFDDPVALPSDGAANRLGVGDLDGDGDSDVLAVLSENDAGQAFLNAGTTRGTWLGLTSLEAVSVGPHPVAVDLGFLDTDAHLDAVIANDGDDTLVALFNDGSGQGTFHPPVVIPLDPGVIAEPRDVAAADFDGDGATDLAVANAAADTVSILLNGGDGSFTLLELVVVDGDPGVLDPCDIDGDRDVDLVVASAAADRVTILRNMSDARPGPGLFVVDAEHVVGSSPVDLTAGDLDSDGLDDIVTANDDDGTLSILLNQGGGDFELGLNLPIGESALSVVTADFDLSGGTDVAAIAVAPGIGLAIRIRLKTNTIPGNTSFDPPLSFVIDATPAFLATADFNEDGETDLVTANTDSGSSAGGDRGGSVTVLLNSPSSLQTLPGDVTGDGVVDGADLSAVIAAWGACAACVEDVDGDGTVGFDDLLIVLANWT